MSLHTPRSMRIVAFEIGVGLVGTTATLMMRRVAAHRSDVDVKSCMANLHRLDELSLN